MASVTGLLRRAALVGLALLSACASTRAPLPGETVTVSRRPWFAVCTGVCPNYDVTVEPDGRAQSVLHAFDRSAEVVPLRISRERRARFHNILAPFRPAGRQPAPAVCDHGVDAQEARLVVKAKEIEITWSGAGGSARLIACDTPENAALRKAIDAALLSLGLDIGGRPLRRAASATPPLCYGFTGPIRIVGCRPNDTRSIRPPFTQMAPYIVDIGDGQNHVTPI